MRVVIVGAGFGGLSAALELGNSAADVTLIDRQNHHLFQPLLYEVATADLSPADIAAPIRSTVRRYRNIRVMLGEVDGVDPAARALKLAGGQTLPYDCLVLAPGSRHAYFGHDEWEPYAPGLKRIDDATEIRRRILLALERAENTEDEDERKRLLTFVIVGGGPTGVEMAGALAELTHNTLRRDFRRIDPRRARIILVEAGKRILTSFREDLSLDATKRLARLGVDVRVGAKVTAIDAEGVTIGDERVPTGAVVWAAGVAASPAAQWLKAEHDHAGRIKVNPDLTVPGHPEIFAIGDTATLAGPDGKPLPGVAPVAKQQGHDVARAIKARILGRSIGPFRYHDYGNLATIGRRAAVVDFGWIHFRGRVAWLIWTVAHIYYLIGFRNRIVVALSWLWAYVTYQRSARLIIQPPK
jgi:NADH dehydrogenase